VNILDLAFDPQDLTVPVGTTVTWTNQGGPAHSVESKNPDGSIDDTGPLNSPLLATGETFEFTFDTVGVFDYRCQPHPSMTGSVTVTE